MGYALSLQQYTPPEFYRQAPDEWVKRLAEIAPDHPGLDRLVFRYFEPTNPDGSDRGWLHNERGQWTLYSAKPIRMVETERASQFEKHWSEMPEGKQAGLHAVVSDYQHFMWHSQGLYVKPFLILQGPWGGTPAKYTETEVAFLRGSDCIAEPLDIGAFPACPFDERVVAQILNRDRLLKVAHDFDALEKLDTPGAMKAETDAAQRLQRETWLDTYKIIIQPIKEYMQSFLRTKEADRVLPRAPEGTSAAVAQWRDHWVETGHIIGATPAIHQRVQVAVH